LFRETDRFGVLVACTSLFEKLASCLPSLEFGSSLLSLFNSTAR
jgi:hypothetical protein